MRISRKSIVGSFLARICLIWLLVLVPLARAQDSVFDLEQWEEKWAGLDTREDISDSQRLMLQTDILEGVGPLVGWRNPTVWDWTRLVLDGWESSAEIELARTEYLSLLSAIGFAAKDSGEELIDEELLRDYYQRGLSIARTQKDEGALLFHIAASLVRSEPDTLETRRRVEAFIQQSLGVLEDQPPRDAVLMMLANLYSEWQLLPNGERSGQSNLLRASAQCRAVLAMDNAREDYKARARAKLDELLESGIRLEIDQRFLPRTQVQLTARTRNIRELDVEVYELPWMADGETQLLEDIQTGLDRDIPDPATMVYRNSFQIAQRNRIDWQEHVLALVDGFPAGIYQVRVTAPGLIESDLMLVSSLDASVIPRQDGSLQIWLADVESGLPVEGAEVRLLNSSGEILHSASSGPQGLAKVEPDTASNWHQVQVRMGNEPALVEHLEDEWVNTGIPWIIPRSVVVSPGEALEWMIVAEEDTVTVDELERMVISLPDGSILLPQIELAGPGIWTGNATIPSSTVVPGPVEIQVSGQARIKLSQLERSGLLPMSVELSGDTFSDRELLFMESSPVDVRVGSSRLETTELPDYIRVIVSSISRQAVHVRGMQDFDGEGQIVYENIFNIGSSPTDAAFFELDNLVGAGEVSVYRIEIRPLDEEVLLGEKYFAVVPYVGQVELRVDQHLLRTGESVLVYVDSGEALEDQFRTPEGELVLFRETWESRYLHRKRGTVISGEEYLQLPERSLLGSAKTDYRLLEEGFVREEADRFRVDLSISNSLEFTLERAGYYNLEFDAGDSDYQPVYPQGPLEVWVIPDGGDLRSFRSDKTRLIVEEAASGAQEVLLLMDQLRTSVLIDLEYSDGDAVTTVLEAQGSALFLEVPSRNAQLVACRGIVIGGGESDHLYRENVFASQSSWSLGEGTDFGLNPGSDFQISLAGRSDFAAVPALWSFFPQDAEKVINGRLLFQQRLHQAQVISGSRDMLSFGQSLPLPTPFESAMDENEPDIQKLVLDDAGISGVLALFPELLQADLTGSSDMNLAGTDPFQIDGQLPNSIGKWNLTLFGLSSEDGLHWASWPVSTELPIRTFLTGPTIVRPGDLPQFLLSVENTTASRQNLSLDLATAGALNLVSDELIESSFRPGQSQVFSIPLQAENPGSGTLDVETIGEFSSIASQTAEVAALPQSAYLKLYHLDSSEAGWSIDLPLQGWTSGKVIAGAGLGSILREIWASIKSAHADSEPMLVALGDWALDSVIEHHGIQASTDPQKWENLEALLTEQQQPGGGWAWSTNHSDDPWLTALILWSLEAFSNSEETSVPDIREGARRFLEQAVVREELDSLDRLNALRSLAGPSFKSQGARPSRIQARAFLEFLHVRDQLSNAETALLLQIARAYGFQQEVDLLANTLSERLASSAGGFGQDFWDHTLIYFSLGDRIESRSARNAVLEAAYSDLDSQASLRGWKTVGGFLNLLGSFLLEGDFAIGGTADMTISGRGRFDFPLNPDSSSGGFAVTKLGSEQLKDGQLQIQLHSLIGSDPLTIAIVGAFSGGEELDPLPEQEEKVIREFIEQTLLTGSRLQLEEVNETSSFQTGDTLQLHLSLYVEGSRSYAEFEFGIPAGASLADESIQHSLEPSTSDAIFTEPIVSIPDQGDPLKRIVRMEPLLPGRHEFILSYLIDWAGEYRFPAHKVIFPDSNEAFSLGSDWTLKVEQAD